MVLRSLVQTAWSTGSALLGKKTEGDSGFRRNLAWVKIFDIGKAGNSQRVVVPDINGRVSQDLAIAVPAAVGGGTAACRVVSADLAENLVFAGLSQVQLQVRVALAVTRCEAETPHTVDLHKGQVKLVKTEGVDSEGRPGGKQV